MLLLNGNKISFKRLKKYFITYFNQDWKNIVFNVLKKLAKNRFSAMFPPFNKNKMADHFFSKAKKSSSL